MQNEAEEPGDDSQNEKAVVDRPAVRLPLKVPKSLEFADTDSDTEDEQEPVAKKTQKASKSDLDDSDDKQKAVVKRPQKASKIAKFFDVDSRADNEQETVVKKPQKAPRPPEFVDTDSTIKDEQGPTVKQPKKHPSQASNKAPCR